jgi:putative endopeptidase
MIRRSTSFAYIWPATALLAASTALSALPAAAQDSGVSAAAATANAHFGKWGVDLSSRDTAVKPGDDFERFASGKWLDTHDIPADQAQNTVGYDAYLRNQARLRAIVTDAPKDSQVGALYASYMDEAHLDQLDAAPMKADLDRVAAIQNKADMVRYMGESAYAAGATLFGIGVIPDPNNPAMNTLFVGSAGLGLPDRDYYLLDKYKPQRDAYHAYIQRTLALIGHPNAAAEADQLLAFETDIAKVSWPRTDLRNFDKINHPMTSAELAAYVPNIDWNTYLTSAKVHTDHMIVADNTAVKAVAELFDKTPIETLKTWQDFKVADGAANYLSKRFVDNKFEFTKTLSGVSQLKPRWQRGMDQIDARLGELVGKTYVADYFSPKSKAMMEQLVANLKVAAGKRIQGNTWMSPETKKAALVKLSKMQVMVGYPDKFRDYSKLELKSDDLYGNVMRSSEFEWDYALSYLDKPVDKKKWGMTPATVNAYNGFLENKIVFPAGILQPPFFDPTADAAANYGAIGAIIGHEIMHGFDDQGRKFDSNGKLHDWWQPADATRFKALTDRLGKQYSSYEAAPGVFINGDLTMGENIGDMSGLQVAYGAYHASLKGKKAPVIDGLTGDQRFFLSFAQAWRGKQRPDSIKTQVASDPHSPRRYRVIGPLRNLDAWYDAFNIKPGSKFYIPPAQRVHLW